MSNKGALIGSSNGSRSIPLKCSTPVILHTLDLIAVKEMARKMPDGSKPVPGRSEEVCGRCRNKDKAKCGGPWLVPAAGRRKVRLTCVKCIVEKQKCLFSDEVEVGGGVVIGGGAVARLLQRTMKPRQKGKEVVAMLDMESVVELEPSPVVIQKKKSLRKRQFMEEQEPQGQKRSRVGSSACEEDDQKAAWKLVEDEMVAVASEQVRLRIRQEQAELRLQKIKNTEKKKLN